MTRTEDGTAAPASERRVPKRSGLLVALATLTFFTLLAPDSLRNLISWYGWGAIALVCFVGSVVFLARVRVRLRLRRWPKTLLLFLLLCIVSIAWSAYPGASVLGVLGQLATAVAGLFFALCLSWGQILRSLGAALRWTIGLSFVFELVVSIFVRQHVLPFFAAPGIEYGDGKLPNAFYWSRDLLFHGGQIQGIVGNSNLFAMIALFGIIVFSIQLRDATVNRTAGIVWLVLAVAALALTRSSTVILATLATAVMFGFALWARRARESRRVPLYITFAAVVVAAVLAVTLLWDPITRVFGKSEDLTGRGAIWNSVISLAQQHPAFGWGWVSYWAPWAEPFKGLAVRNGVAYLQAHNAWLDLWLQVGIVGLVVFALLTLTTLGRAWFFAVDRPAFDSAKVVRADVPYTAITLLPLLILTALLAQSVAESRILIEGGFSILVMLAVKTKIDRP